MWPRLKGKGFKDQKLPADWYELVKDKDGTVGGTVEMAGEIMEQSAVLAPMVLRFPGMRTRAIGGKALLGDVLFLKEFQPYLDGRLTYYKKLNTMLDNVISRMEDEFPVEFAGRPPVLPPKKAFDGPGFRSLQIGMRMNSVDSSYSLIAEDYVLAYGIYALSGDWLKIGTNQLTSTTIVVHKGELCRIILKFDQNRDQIFKLFQQRYQQQTRRQIGSPSIAEIATQPGSDVFAAIYGLPNSSDNSKVDWFEIVFEDTPAYEEIRGAVRYK